MFRLVPVWMTADELMQKPTLLRKPASVSNHTAFTTRLEAEYCHLSSVHRSLPFAFPTVHLGTYPSSK